MDRTLVIVKPDGVERGLAGEVVGRLERKNLRLVAAELRTITKEVAETHYAEHREKPFFSDLVTFITRSSALLLVVEGPKDTYAVVRLLIGATNPAEAAPGTIRGDFGDRDRPRTSCTARTRTSRRRGRSHSSSPDSPRPSGSSSRRAARGRQTWVEPLLRQVWHAVRLVDPPAVP